MDQLNSLGDVLKEELNSTKYHEIKFDLDLFHSKVESSIQLGFFFFFENWI